MTHFKPLPPAMRGAVPFCNVLEKTKERIEAGGSMAVDDAWRLLRMEYSYVTVCLYFKLVMEQLIAAKLAVKVRQGQYELAEGIVLDLTDIRKKAATEKHKWENKPESRETPVLPPETGGLTKFSAQDPGTRRIGPFYSKVYGQYINL